MRKKHNNKDVNGTKPSNIKIVKLDFSNCTIDDWKNI